MREAKSCPVCGDTFTVARWDRERKYCSTKCYGISQRNAVPRSCPVCGKTWPARPSDPEVCCSRACRSKMIRRRETRHCRVCGKGFETTTGQDKQFCGRECYQASRRRPPHARACRKCGLVKHESKFANPSWCKQCAGTAQRASIAKPAGRYKYAANDARRRGREWTLTQEQHEDFMRQPCHYCGGKLGLRGVGLDRIDNGKGYTTDNVVPCCGRCNRVKHDFFTYEEMLILGKTIADIDAKRAGAYQTSTSTT